MSDNGFIVNDDMFGAYVKIPTGASRDMHIYKVIGRIESNGYCDVPIMGKIEATPHSEIVPVLNVVHCGVSEDTVIRVALSDCEIIQQPNAPLTLEELREMGGEPVWVETKTITDRKFWAIVYVNPKTNELTVEDKLYTLHPGNYGKTWFAYRRKPDTQKEDKHEAG